MKNHQTLHRKLLDASQSSFEERAKLLEHALIESRVEQAEHVEQWRLTHEGKDPHIDSMLFNAKITDQLVTALLKAETRKEGNDIAIDSAAA